MHSLLINKDWKDNRPLFIPTNTDKQLYNYDDKDGIRTPKYVKFFTLLWCVFVVLCLIIPGQSIDGFDTEYIPAISTGIFIIIGLIIFIIKNKNKNAIL